MLKSWLLRLNAKRVRRGSIDFDLPEPVVEFDPDGNMKKPSCTVGTRLVGTG